MYSLLNVIFSVKIQFNWKTTFSGHLFIWFFL